MSARRYNATPALHRLRNGLRVVTTPMPNAHTMSISFAVRAGSVYDPPRAPGLAHFIEHLIFKATDDYTRPQLAAAMQRLGRAYPTLRLAPAAGEQPRQARQSYREVGLLAGLACERDRLPVGRLRDRPPVGGRLITCEQVEHEREHAERGV